MKKALGQWLQNSSISQKIVAAMTAVLVATMALYMASTLLITRSQLLDKTRAAAGKDLQMVAEKMDMLFDGVQNDAVLVLASDPVQKLLAKTGQQGLDSAGRYTLYRTINESMLSIINSEGTYRSVVFYDTEGRAYMPGNMTADEPALTAHVAEVLDFAGDGGNERLLTLHESPWKASRQGDDCISYLRKVYAAASGTLIGVMELEISGDAVLALYQSATGEGNHFAVADEAGTVVSSDEAHTLYENLHSESWYAPLQAGGAMQADGDTFYNARGYPRFGWTIVYATAKTAFKQDLAVLTVAHVLIAAVLFGCVIALSRVLIRSITKPIGTITRTVQEIGRGNYESKVEVKSGGELGTLACEFNRMVDKTGALMERIRSTERQKRESELGLIQLQMTPHFFYNILESINGLILLDEKKTAIRTVQHLSDFYRGVLGRGKEVIPLAAELQIAENYLAIMQTCYPDTFTYTVDVEPGCEATEICKLTLQPILENAVYHGIVASGRKGRIAITARRQGGAVAVGVQDDGGGIAPAVLAGLYAPGGAKTDMDSFGIRNTDDRIKLYFGAEYGLAVDTEEGRGTSVTITLPASGEGAPCTPC